MGKIFVNIKKIQWLNEFSYDFITRKMNERTKLNLESEEIKRKVGIWTEKGLHFQIFKRLKI